MPITQQLAEKYVGHTIRPLHEIEKNSINSLLLNSHPAFDYGIPLPPNTLEIAGLNAQTIKPIDGEIVITYPEVREIVHIIFTSNKIAIFAE